jgi:hypothetical protein
MAKKGNKNAVKHGIYAKEILLPNESAEEFEQLHQAFRLRYNPIDETEEAIVGGLVVIQWQIGRLDGRLRRAFELDDRLASEIGHLPINIMVELAKTTNDKTPIPFLDQRAKALNLVRQLAEINPALDDVARILKLREQLEKSFDKGVGRLVNQKEYQKLYGAKRSEPLPKAETTSLAPDATDTVTAKGSENAQSQKGAI